MLEGFAKIPFLSRSSFMTITCDGIKFNGKVVFHMQKG